MSVDEAERMLEAVSALLTANDLSAVQQIVRTAARRATGADGATFVLRDVDQCYYADEDAISPLWKGQRFPLTNCISGWAMINAQRVVVPDIFEDSRVPLEAYRPTFVRSLAVVPVGADGPVAAIGAYWAGHHTATASELAALEELAAATSAALRRLGRHTAPLATGAAPVLGAAPGAGVDPVDRQGSDALAGAEREQIARDLHDTILQRLFGSGLRLQRLVDTVGEATVASEIDEVVGQIDETIRELRGVIYGLEYGHQRLGGLHGAILAVAAESARVLGFKPRVVLDSSMDAVDDDLRREIVNALREMLSNVARHAAASVVTVECVAGAAVRLRVTDDGVGIDGSAPVGNGLANLRRRAEALGGSFTVGPADGQGTRATFSVPLQVEAGVA